MEAETTTMQPSVFTIVVPTMFKKLSRAIQLAVLFMGAFINTLILLGAMIAVGAYTFTLLIGFYAAAYFRGADSHDFILLLQGYLGLFIFIGMIKAFIYMTK